MSDDFHIVYIILTVSAVIGVMVFFIVFSVIQYQRSRKHHENELDAVLVKNQKEMLTVQLEIKEKTLGTISEELHDNVGQILSLTKLNIHQIVGEDNAPNVKESIGLLNKAIESIRGISHIISSNILDDTHLTDLLTEEIEHLNNSGAYDSHLYMLTDREIEIGPEKAFIIYRMVQESINNIVKHAKANKIDIFIRDVDDSFGISVNDDGEGFAKSNGLQNIFKIAVLIDAKLQIFSESDKGTEVKIIFSNDYDKQSK
jgi:two-component system NarL family sensor kinase